MSRVRARPPRRGATDEVLNQTRYMSELDPRREDPGFLLHEDVTAAVKEYCREGGAGELCLETRPYDFNNRTTQSLVVEFKSGAMIKSSTDLTSFLSERLNTFVDLAVTPYSNSAESVVSLKVTRPKPRVERQRISPARALLLLLAIAALLYGTYRVGSAAITIAGNTRAALSTLVHGVPTAATSTATAATTGAPGENGSSDIARNTGAMPAPAATGNAMPRARPNPARQDPAATVAGASESGRGVA